MVSVTNYAGATWSVSEEEDTWSVSLITPALHGQ